MWLSSTTRDVLLLSAGVRAMSDDKRRIPLDVTAELNRTLDELVAERDAGNRSEALRKAIAIMETVAQGRRRR